METILWIENWLLKNGFLKSDASFAFTEYRYSHKNGDSTFFQFWFDEGETPKITIVNDASGSAHSQSLLLPKTFNDLSALLWFHGIAVE